jgi:pyruvate formate lyase activating enzyme
LEQRKGLIDWVSICWWEPTIQPDLYEFAQKIKKMWFCVKLDTNGRDVKIVKKMVEDWILDYVAVDLKWPLSNYEKWSWVVDLSDFLENYKELLDFLRTW